jgi:hypothetical protein
MQVVLDEAASNFLRTDVVELANLGVTAHDKEP